MESLVLISQKLLQYDSFLDVQNALDLKTDAFAPLMALFTTVKKVYFENLLIGTKYVEL